MGANRRVGFAFGANGTQFFAREDASGHEEALGNGSTAAFHTIEAFGMPGSSLYDWYLDGTFINTRDLLDNTASAGNFVSMSSGSSALVLAATDWNRVSLELWEPEDLEIALPNGTEKSFPRWVPPVNGHACTITFLGSSGDLAFTAPPTVDANGTLRFTPTAQTSCSAAFEVFTPHGAVTFQITANNSTSSLKRTPCARLYRDSISHNQRKDRAHQSLAASTWNEKRNCPHPQRLQLDSS